MMQGAGQMMRPAGRIIQEKGSGGNVCCCHAAAPCAVVK